MPALAAVAYWRTECGQNNIQITFVIGKTSCAPLRYNSVLRLELQVAVMAVSLKETIAKNHEFRNFQTYFWSDSHTVIQWKKSDHRKYKQYVANRVAEILENSEEEQWR